MSKPLSVCLTFICLFVAPKNKPDLHPPKKNPVDTYNKNIKNKNTQKRTTQSEGGRRGSNAPSSFLPHLHKKKHDRSITKKKQKKTSHMRSRATMRDATQIPCIHMHANAPTLFVHGKLAVPQRRRQTHMGYMNEKQKRETGRAGASRKGEE